MRALVVLLTGCTLCKVGRVRRTTRPVLPTTAVDVILASQRIKERGRDTGRSGLNGLSAIN